MTSYGVPGPVSTRKDSDFKIITNEITFSNPFLFTPIRFFKNKGGWLFDRLHVIDDNMSKLLEIKVTRLLLEDPGG